MNVSSGEQGRSPAPASPAPASPAPAHRRAARSRQTKETSIEVSVDLDGAGSVSASTGLPFFDHMLSQLGRHAGWDLTVAARGDIEVDAHHTVEDTGIVIGEVLAEALGDKAGIRRFGWSLVPLDEALIEVALDLSGRPFLHYEVEIPPDTPPLGSPPFDPQLAEEFWRAVTSAAGLTLHVRKRSGRNVHHVVEATFKSVARSLRDAQLREGGGVPSTKGTL